MSALPAANDERAPPKLVPAFNLLKDFKPIESIVDRLPIGRGSVTSVTANTGHGKTTWATLLQVSLVRGLSFAGREVTQGSVLVLAGENPDDYTMHLAATTQDLGLYGSDLSRPRPMGQLMVVPGKFRIDYEMDHLRHVVERDMPDLVAIFIDTSAAFYEGAEENDNVGMMKHADTLRELTTFVGRPSVIVLCHPVKNANRDALVPRGGGAFLTQVDANLTLWKDDAGVVTLHWAGKVRGAHFDPVHFELASLQLDGYADVRGRPIFSSVVRHLPDEKAEQIEGRELDRGNRLLLAMLRQPGESIAEWCRLCGFMSGSMQPQKSIASRQLAQLTADGLVEKTRQGVYSLTRKGKKEAEGLL